MNEVTLALLRMHVRQQTYHLPEPSSDLKRVFPRLAMVGMSNLQAQRIIMQSDPAPLSLTIYRSLSVAQVMRATRPTALSRPLDRPIGVSLFGAFYFDSDTAGDRIKPEVFREIIEIAFMPGASIRQARGQIGMEGWHCSYRQVYDYTLDIEDEVPDSALEETLSVVLAHLAVSPDPQVGESFGSAGESKLEIRCHPSVFERFVDSVSQISTCRETLSF